jgi:hypothetical protein
MTVPSPFVVLSRKVAADFLQTVVVIDDEARFQVDAEVESVRPAGDITSNATLAAAGAAGQIESTPTLTAPTDAQIQAAVEEPVDSHDLDAKAVTDGFAERGLVCAVLRPTSDEVIFTAPTTAVARADIVVLDWVLHNDNGAKTLELISSLIESDSDRLRLIAIYTGQKDLKRIADRILEVVSQRADMFSVQQPNAFSVERGPVRISVFAKPGTRIPKEDAQAYARIKASSELPDALINEFAEMTTGLVPHVTLASLAALRRNSHRMLRRLSPSLDPAYLWHRANHAHPRDAEADLKAMIVGELAAVVADEKVEAHADINAISAWLDDFISGGDYKERFALSENVNRQQVLELLTKGSKGDENIPIRERFSALVSGKAHTRTHQCFAQGIAENTKANEDFAMLLSVRNHYEPPTPILSLGTVLKIGTTAQAKYWMCVQPECDSLRLKQRTAFPLLPLEIVPVGEPFHLVVRSADTESVRLRVLSKPMNLRMEPFDPTDVAAGTVSAALDTGEWFFGAASGVRYTWIADMKPQHALWFADLLSSQMRRVGLVQSEWLRRWSDSVKD